MAGGNDGYTKVLLPMTGSNGGTTFTDVNAGGSAHTWTASGNAQTSTAQSTIGLSSSGLFDGTGDYISTPSNASDMDLTGDFSVDLFVRLTTLSRENVFVVREDGSGGAALMVRLNTANQLDCFIRDGTGGSLGSIIGRITATSGVSLNTWTHVAYNRTGSRFDGYVAGVSVGNTSTATAGGNGFGYQLDVGGRHAGGAGESTVGNIQQVRISKGIGRYPNGTSFTPPTSVYDGWTSGAIRVRNFVAKN